MDERFFQASQPWHALAGTRGSALKTGMGEWLGNESFDVVRRPCAPQLSDVNLCLVDGV